MKGYDDFLTIGRLHALRPLSNVLFVKRRNEVSRSGVGSRLMGCSILCGADATVQHVAWTHDTLMCTYNWCFVQFHVLERIVQPLPMAAELAFAEHSKRTDNFVEVERVLASALTFSINWRAHRACTSP